MAHTHVAHVAPQPRATIRLGSFDVPYAILASDDVSAHVRVVAAGGAPEHLTVLRDGETRRARVAIRKQGPLGLDLRLALQGERDARAA